MSRRLRLLATADAVGGIWTYCLELARHLQGDGVETILALFGPSPSEGQREAARRAGARLVETGLPLDWTASSPEELIKAGRQLAVLGQELGADLIQTNAPAMAAEADHDIPVVAVHHSCVATWWSEVRAEPLPRDFAWRTELTASGLAAADRVVVPTRAFGDMVQRVYGLEEAPTVVHNGRSPLRLPSVAPHDFAFTAGRLWDEGKNVCVLDRAAGRIPIPVHAAGPLTGPNGAAVRLSHVHPLGLLEEEEMARWLSARPVFVSVARYEPFGLAVLEAAMAGCPLVLSDIPTFRELWDGAARFIAPEDDVALARAITELAGDDFARTTNGRAARDRAARYTAAGMAGGMARLYRSLLPGAPASDRKTEARVAA